MIDKFYEAFVKPMLDWVIANDYGVVNILENKKNLEPCIRYRLYDHSLNRKNLRYIGGKAIEEFKVMVQIGDMYNEKVWLDFLNIYMNV